MSYKYLIFVENPKSDVFESFSVGLILGLMLGLGHNNYVGCWFSFDQKYTDI